MSKLTIRILVLAFALVMAACAQTGGGRADYRNEMGGNGLPTPRALLARYVEALGGERVITAHTSHTMEGTFNLAAFGLQGDATIFSAAPNRSSQIIELPGFGRIENGFNGEAGWSVDPMQGTTVLRGTALEDLRARSDFYLPLNYADFYTEMETQELTTTGGRDAYLVKMMDSQGRESSHYFSSESALLIQLDQVTSTPVGEVPTYTSFAEYREFDGYMMPVSMTINSAGQEFTIEIDSITFDNVSDDAFIPPASVQSQL